VSPKTILILGGGMGGIMAAGHLRRACPAEHRIVVIERSETFSLRMANLWLMTGERRRPEDGQCPMSRLAERGIEWVHAEIESIDPTTRTVETSAGQFEGDYLVIALGAERHPEAVPGFAEAALKLYEPAGAIGIRKALEGFAGGRIVVLVARTPFSCPSAPYEAAFLIEALLHKRGMRQDSEIAVYTPEDLPMPVAGPAVGSALVQMLEKREIEFHAEQIVMRVDPSARLARFELEDTGFDVLIGVPPHRVPQVLHEANLLDASGWVPVDPATLQTRHAGVYAVGDATAIRLPVGMFLPKAGVFADEQARVVAENLAAQITGGPSTSRFDGNGFCYIEVGNDMAAYGAGNFYSVPAPTVMLEPPSPRFLREKHELERTAQALWL
jgi:sulfide:quinone oxidoreductase